MEEVRDIQAALGPAQQTLKRVRAARDPGGGHAHDRLELEADGAGVARDRLVQRSGRRCGMQAAGQHAVFHQIGVARTRALVVIGAVAGAVRHAGVQNAQALPADLLAQLPLPAHRLGAEHEVRLALVAEALMGKHTGDRR